MDSNPIYAPFTDEQVRILNIWQNNEHWHPYTCCNHENMIPTNEGLKCPICERIQNWVHDFSVDEAAASYDPWKKFKKESGENV